MPIFQYSCLACERPCDHITSFALRDELDKLCIHCGGKLQWAGLSAPSIGREQRFGAILQDGTRIKGGLDRVKRGATRV